MLINSAKNVYYYSQEHLLDRQTVGAFLKLKAPKSFGNESRIKEHMGSSKKQKSNRARLEPTGDEKELVKTAKCQRGDVN